MPAGAESKALRRCLKLYWAMPVIVIMALLPAAIPLSFSSDTTEICLGCGSFSKTHENIIFGIGEPVIDPSPLLSWFDRHGKPHTHTWRFFGKIDITIYGAHNGYTCGKAPAIGFNRKVMAMYLAKATAAEVETLVNLCESDQEKAEMLIRKLCDKLLNDTAVMPGSGDKGSTLPTP